MPNGGSSVHTGTGFALYAPPSAAYVAAEDFEVGVSSIDANRKPPGTGNPVHVLSQHTRLTNPHQDTTRIRETPIRSTASRSRCATVSIAPGVPSRTHYKAHRAHSQADHEG